jgi:hypothetical protein
LPIKKCVRIAAAAIILVSSRSDSRSTLRQNSKSRCNFEIATPVSPARACCHADSSHRRCPSIAGFQLGNGAIVPDGIDSRQPLRPISAS